MVLPAFHRRAFWRVLGSGFPWELVAVCLIYWRKYFFIYDHRFLFVVGLVFSRSLAYYAIVDNLMWYFIDHDVPFVKSTVFANIQESLSSVFVILMAHSADSFVGRFRTILFSSTAFICGIMLLLIFNPYDVTWLAVIILVLLALGRSGDNLLENILADLVNEADKSEDRNKKRSEARAALWHRIPHASGAISATLWVAPYALVRSHSTWNSAFFICLISMTTTLMIFCKGHGVYCQGKLTHRPVEIFYRVIRARIHKLLCNSKSRCSTYDTSSQGRSLERNVENDEPIRLATRGEIEQRNNRVYKEDVRVIRSLLRMFPLWGNFFVVSLTSAVGSTFYIEQYNNLENKYHIPVQIYDVTQSFSHFIVPFLYQLTCFSRLRKLKNMVDDDEIPISFLWLVPQFVMLGFMEGLTQKGMLKFFKSQVEKPVKNYGEEYMELVMSLGKLANVVLVLILNAQTDWFRVYTNNVPRLNMYYLLLICSGYNTLLCEHHINETVAIRYKNELFSVKVVEEILPWSPDFLIPVEDTEPSKAERSVGRQPRSLLHGRLEKSGSDSVGNVPDLSDPLVNNKCINEADGDANIDKRAPIAERGCEIEGNDMVQPVLGALNCRDQFCGTVDPQARMEDTEV
ncbi:hypothetical protein R6Q59_026328 [Mikania micrantha]